MRLAGINRTSTCEWVYNDNKGAEDAKRRYRHGMNGGRKLAYRDKLRYTYAATTDTTRRGDG